MLAERPLSNWQRLKQDPVKMVAYQKWQRQYNLRKKQKERTSTQRLSRKHRKSVADVKIRYEGVIYNITDLLLTVDLHDHEIIAMWKGLKAITRAVYGKGAGV